MSKSLDYRKNLELHWQQYVPGWKIPTSYHVHHIRPKSTFEDKNDPMIDHPKNLIALHPDDHYDIHRCRGDKYVRKGFMSVCGRKTPMASKTKQKLSKAHAGKKHSPETREKMRLAHLGKKHSNLTKQKIGNAHKGKIISDDQKEHLSKLNTGTTRSDETKKRIAETMKEQYANGERKPLRGMLGKKMSTEAKAKISKGNKGKKRTKEQREAASKINKGRSWKVVNGKREWFDVK